MTMYLDLCCLIEETCEDDDCLDGLNGSCSCFDLRVVVVVDEKYNENN